MSCNTIFSWQLLHKIKASIINKNNDLISGILGDQFKLDIMVPQRAKKSPIISGGFPVLFPVAFQKHKITRRTEAAGIARWN